MRLMNILKQNWGVVLYIFVSLLTILPFFSPGFFNIHDNTQVERVFQMSQSLKDGMFPVRWVPDLGYGYGYAIFNFYSVLPYYIGGLMVLLGLGVLSATKLIFAASLILSGLSMFVFVRKFFGQAAALVAAVIYLYFPYHAVNVFVRGDLAELFAYVFLPLVFYGLFSIHENIREGKNNLSYVLIASLSVASVVISHNLTAFMLFIFVFLFMGFSIGLEKDKKKLIIHYATVLVIGFLLSAFYSIPAILEMRYSNVLSQVGGGSHWGDHFVCLSQLWNSQWGFGGSAPGCIDGVSFKLGKVNILLSTLAVFAAVIFTKRIGKPFFIAMFSFMSLAFSVFMTLEASSLIWMIPFMDFLQFPWRFINFVGLFISVIIGFLVWIVGRSFGKYMHAVFAIVIIVVTVYTNQQLFNPQIRTIEEESHYTDKERINWTVSKISDEYLPRGFKKPEAQEDIPVNKIEIAEGVGTIDSLISKTNNLSADVGMVTDGLIKMNIAYFPAWSIYLNDEKASYVIGDDGLYVPLKRGDYDIEARFEQTLIEKVSNLLTLVGIGLVVAVIINKRLRKIYG